MHVVINGVEVPASSCRVAIAVPDDEHAEDFRHHMADLLHTLEHSPGVVRVNSQSDYHDGLLRMSIDVIEAVLVGGEPHVAELG